ncbi:MAG: septation regulator SpoVG [bacterium]|nr:septation regulator SpoVG [bacterium]
MNITQVKVFPVYEEKLKAFVSVVFDHAFMVNDIKVIQGKDGLFLSMPSRRKKNGEFKDVAHPLNNETRRMLEERVLSEYRQVVDDPTPRRPDRQAGAAQAPAASRPEAAQQGGAPQQAGVPQQNVPQQEVASSEVVIAAGDSVTSPGEKTLEEVQEMHLRDSFWSVS